MYCTSPQQAGDVTIADSQSVSTPLFTNSLSCRTASNSGAGGYDGVLGDNDDSVSYTIAWPIEIRAFARIRNHDALTDVYVLVDNGPLDSRSAPDAHVRDAHGVFLEHFMLRLVKVASHDDGIAQFAVGPNE